MINTIQFARGNFSKFIENLSSDVANPVPPSYVAQKAAEMLFQKYEVSIDPENLRYQEGSLLGEFNVNVVNDKIREHLKESNATLDPNEVIRAFLAELDNTCKEFNIKRRFASGMPFVNMDGDKVDLVISCGDGYLARLPMERMTIEKYLGLKDPSKNKIKPTDNTKHNWRKEIINYLKEVKCQDSDEQREVNGLINCLESSPLESTENTTYSPTPRKVEFSLRVNGDKGLDILMSQMVNYFNSLKEKDVYPVIKGNEITLVRTKRDTTSIVVTDDTDIPGVQALAMFDKDLNKID